MSLSAYPITVEGVRLDTFSYGVMEHRLSTPGVREADLMIPGADGVVPSIWDDSEPAMYGLTIFVRGANDTGGITSGKTAQQHYQENLDEIIHLFRGYPHRLKTVTRQVDDAGTIRQAQVKVVDVITPEEDSGSHGVVKVSMMIPSGYWEDTATQDWSTLIAASGTDYFVTTLEGGTAPVHDAILLVTGPVANPIIQAVETGADLRLNATLAAGETWRVNSGTWSSRTGTVGAPLTLASADTAGTDRAGITTFTGGTARYLTITTRRTSRNVRSSRLELLGTGIDPAATSLAVRARRKYLL